ncbi:MAG: hypothetical protein ACI3W5_09555 [Faecousia sp.]
MLIVNFGDFVEKVCLVLDDLSKTNPKRIAACKTGEDFEECVVEAIATVINQMGIDAKIRYTKGGHAFPDIVIEFSDGSKYGIEVKSSTSSTSKNWKINGNSVLGSTKEDVIDTYIVFGKTAIGNQGFRCKRYEDAIANVAVTHSPRYAIDMEIANNETFFAKSGLTYKQISESEDPIGQITAYFRSQGQKAWWLAESTPAAIRMFSDLEGEEQLKLLGYCFAHFPEVFSSRSNKFSRCAMWLVAEHSIVSSSLRDNFSAGGRFEYLDFGRIPRIYKTLEDCREYVLQALDDATVEELYEDWGLEYRSSYANFDKFIDWAQIASNYCPPVSETGYVSLKLFRSIMRK